LGLDSETAYTKTELSGGAGIAGHHSAHYPLVGAATTVERAVTEC